MSRKLSRMLALVSVLACSSLALAQDDAATTFNIADVTRVLGPVLSFIWFIFFIKWGGFRWIS